MRGAAAATLGREVAEPLIQPSLTRGPPSPAGEKERATAVSQRARAWHNPPYVPRRRRPALVLFLGPRQGRAPLRLAAHPRAMEELHRPLADGDRLCLPLSRFVRARGGAGACLHAGGAGRGELALLRPPRLGAGRGDDDAAAQCLHRPRARRACAGVRGASARTARGNLAHPDARRAHGADRAEPHGALGAVRHDAVRPRAALFARAAARAHARVPVLADLLGRGALRAALCRALSPAARGLLRAARRALLAARRRRAYRRGDEAGLPANRRAARRAAGGAPARAGAGARAGRALARWVAGWQCPGLGSARLRTAPRRQTR